MGGPGVFLDAEITPRFPNGLTLLPGSGQYEQKFHQESVRRADEQEGPCVSF